MEQTRPFEPMKAEKLTHHTQIKRWPMLASPKFDGYRCVVRDGVAMSYNLKPIRNSYVQSRLGKPQLNGLDGELIVGPPNEGLVFNRTSSGVTKKTGEPDFTFFVFDDFAAHGHGFRYRLGRAEDRIEDLGDRRVVHVEHEIVESSFDLDEYEARVLGFGYEGVVLRDPAGPYKHGRSSVTEGWAWKLKRFVDGEAVVLAVEEGRSNQNEAERDAFGRVKRSSHQANQSPAGRVGTLIAKDIDTGATLRVSPGCLTAEERVRYFQFPQEIVGRMFTYKSFGYGQKDIPRYCTFKAFRDPNDRGSPGAGL